MSINLAIDLFLLDQVTKIMARRIEPGKHIDIVKDKVTLTHVRNKGAAYGLLENSPRTLMAATVCAALWFAGEIFRIHKDKGLNHTQKNAAAFIAGGALGNITDRIRQKHVTDFIHIRWGKNAPVFNLADVFIVFGALSFVVGSLFGKGDNR